MNAVAAAIDPELAAANALLRERGLVALNPAAAPLGDARAALARISAFLNEGSVPLDEESDLRIPVSGPASGRDILCRLYRPDGIARPPLLVYAHGGSFALGDLDGWDGALRALVRQSGIAILHVDYRLAPEHRFPAAFDDIVAAIRHVTHSGEALGIDPQRLAVGGDSAGANLALGAALALRDAGASPLRFLLLHYGAYSTDGDSPSWRRFGSGAYVLSRAQLDWVWSTYLSHPGQKTDWRVAPLLAPLAGLPPAHLAIGTLDPLLDDNERLAAGLAAAGVPCRLVRYDGLVHGYIRYGRLVGSVGRAIADSAAALRMALGD
ncbi:acetyl esterase [Enhydrobacter aerosaccus]|uniref:Acetyl esterase n=1 Tax=Enhydrobacter aerosaccus TaxID=225324 RepID=A0A1T4TN27_9HYPH|nr:alpha/beta hydrolase [Enhydrobacter aerosaccus]SKA41824.1 acetyl esterase [Enhydrobacter aerosaccus]